MYISVNSFFSKAKKMAETPKTKNLIEGLRRIAERSSSGMSEEKSLDEMRKLLFRNGFSPSDVDLAFMQAQQPNMFSAPSLDFQKDIGFTEMPFEDKKAKETDMFKLFGFGIPMPKARKQSKKKNSLPPIRLPPMAFPQIDINSKQALFPSLEAPRFKGQKKNKGAMELDFVKNRGNGFSFVPKKPKGKKEVDALFRKILWG